MENTFSASTCKKRIWRTNVSSKSSLGLISNFKSKREELISPHTWHIIHAVYYFCITGTNTSFGRTNSTFIVAGHLHGQIISAHDYASMQESLLHLILDHCLKIANFFRGGGGGGGGGGALINAFSIASYSIEENIR